MVATITISAYSCLSYHKGVEPRRHRLLWPFVLLEHAKQGIVVMLASIECYIDSIIMACPATDAALLAVLAPVVSVGSHAATDAAFLAVLAPVVSVGPRGAAPDAFLAVLAPVVF